MFKLSQSVIFIGWFAVASAQDAQRNKDFLTYGRYHGMDRVTLLREQKSGDLRLPNFITDSMVLQRGENTSIWGWTKPGMPVHVRFGEISVEAKADVKGKWRAVFPTLKENAAGQTLLVSSGDDIMAMENVIVGDVWLCSGQSNMDFPLQRCLDAKTDPNKLVQSIIDRSENPSIRVLEFHNVSPYGPAEDLNITRWMPATPKDVGNFSAVAYLYAREIYNATGVPIGLIDTSWGGSMLEPWVSPDELKKLESAGDYLKANAAKMAAWTPEVEKKAIAENEEKEQQYQSQLSQHFENLKLGKPTRLPRDFYWGAIPPQYGRDYTGNLFNGMIHPLREMNLAGVIWYQGESNANRALAYRESFPLLIRSWRSFFNKPQLPFYWVQLSSFDPKYKPEDEPGESKWAELREAQTMTTSQPCTGEAMSYDLGDAKDIHPKQKLLVAKRLALHALKNVYSKQDVITDGPIYASHLVQGPKVVLTFTPQGLPLMAGEAVPFQQIKKSSAPLRGFAVAGEDHVFHWADAMIVGDTVEVTCGNVPNPQAVRYAWGNFTDANLYNSQGLPAKPFRTDSSAPPVKSGK